MKKFIYLLLISLSIKTEKIQVNNLPLNNLQINETLFILIHGTWANKNDCWHTGQNEFFRNIEKSLKSVNGKLIGFCWDGKLSHKSRYEAGQKLANFIQNQTYCQVSIIAHSHGANVAIIASQILKDYKYKKIIKSIYSLGCPINIFKYMPNMETIEYFYNFFSYNDFVQPIIGFYDRTFPKHQRIANIQITIDGKNPGHCQMHSPIIARWLPLIHHNLSNLKIGNFHNFNFQSDCTINFFSLRSPELIIN